MRSDLLDRTVSEIMTRNPKTIDAEALASEAVNLMNARKITNVFVLEDARPIGVVHIHDCLRAGVV
jgi:arabinose-5-phosphate isomerase